MVDLALLQSVSYIAGALGVCVAAAYYVMNLRATIQTREAQLFMQIFDRFKEQDFWHGITKMRENELSDFAEKTKIKLTMDEYNELNSICAYFEGIGVMLKRGYIKEDMINDFMPITILNYTDNIRPFLKWRIERGGSPYRWKNLQYLYNIVKETNEAHLKGYDGYLMIFK
jgi:hypothetical protein